jgi:hypothetical protein
MFSVIVSGSRTAWETDGVMRIAASRFNHEYSDSEGARVSLKDPNSLRLVEQAPVLLMYEPGGDELHKDIVRIGTVENVEISRSTVLFNFRERGRLSRADIEEFAERLGIGRFELGTTHWAIKNGRIPTALLNRVEPTSPKYDVVLSFAGEDRDYVEEVASRLKTSGVDVFYDRYEEASLWGKDLVEHFDSVYRNDGRYCVMFISSAYAEKMWTRHERRSALARGLDSKREYVLPARFDDTSIDGLRATTAYVDCRRLSPSDLVERIIAKMRGLGHDFS